LEELLVLLAEPRDERLVVLVPAERCRQQLALDARDRLVQRGGELRHAPGGFIERQAREIGLQGTARAFVLGADVGARELARGSDVHAFSFTRGRCRLRARDASGRGGNRPPRPPRSGPTARGSSSVYAARG